MNQLLQGSLISSLLCSFPGGKHWQGERGRKDFLPPHPETIPLALSALKASPRPCANRDQWISSDRKPQGRGPGTPAQRGQEQHCTVPSSPGSSTLPASRILPARQHSPCWPPERRKGATRAGYGDTEFSTSVFCLCLPRSRVLVAIRAQGLRKQSSKVERSQVKGTGAGPGASPCLRLQPGRTVQELLRRGCPSPGGSTRALGHRLGRSRDVLKPSRLPKGFADTGT